MKVYLHFPLTDKPAGGGNQFLRALSGELKRENFLSEHLDDADVVLINNYHEHEIFCQEPERIAGKVVVHRVAGRARLQAHPLDQRDQLTKIINAHFVDATIFQTHWARQEWAKDGMTGAGDVAVIINAPDPSIFYAPPARQLDAGRKLKIIAASWSANWNKGFSVYRWLDEHLDFGRYEFMFAGNAPIRFKHIHMLPTVTSVQLAELYRQSDVYLTAVRHEPCSNALIEAVHCGLPAIALNEGGNPEIVGPRGLLFDTADQIPGLLEHVREKYQSFCLAQALPTLTSVARQYTDFMRRVCEHRRPKVFSVGAKARLRRAALSCSAMDRVVYWSQKISRQLNWR